MTLNFRFIEHRDYRLLFGFFCILGLLFNSPVYVGSGLFTNCLLDGFQIAGSDGKFEWANAVVLSNNKVKVWSNNVINPTVVRYAWDDNPAWANLKIKEGLPTSPFTTKN